MNGKGSKPRNCFTKEFRDNYDTIDWGKTPLEKCMEDSQEKYVNEYITDGFGNSWSKKCPICGKNSIVIVRPGKVQCNNCE